MLNLVQRLSVSLDKALEKKFWVTWKVLHAYFLRRRFL